MFYSTNCFVVFVCVCAIFCYAFGLNTLSLERGTEKERDKIIKMRKMTTQISSSFFVSLLFDIVVYLSSSTSSSSFSFLVFVTINLNGWSVFFLSCQPNLERISVGSFITGQLRQTIVEYFYGLIQAYNLPHKHACGAHTISLSVCF